MTRLDDVSPSLSFAGLSTPGVFLTGQPSPARHDQYADDFGRETADDDLARSDDPDLTVFIDTQRARDFIDAEPGIPFIVGTMGAGKSLLLFKKYAQVVSKRGVITAPLDDHATPPLIAVPATSSRAFTPQPEYANTLRLTNFWQLEKDGQANVDAWTQLWEWALLGCVLHQWVPYAASKHAEAFREILAIPNIDSDPYDAIARYLSVAADENAARGGPKLPNTRVLRRFVEAESNHFPPTYIFLDNQDEFFNDAPEFWSGSALGCKAAIDQIRRRSSHRIHFFLTLRPEVLWRTALDPHSARSVDDIFRVEWSTDELEEMFKRRITRLRANRLIEPRLRITDPFAAFFGPTHYRGTWGPYISNHAVAESPEKPIEEPLWQYIFRHTLGRPREIIMIGNAILRERAVVGVAAAGSQDTVRTAVAKVASTIAEAYLGEIKQRWPWRKKHEERPVSLVRFFRDHIESNVISRPSLTQIEDEFIDSCDLGRDSGFRPFSILAAAGLIGWPTQALNRSGRMLQFFPKPGNGQEMPLPPKAGTVLIHPVLYGPRFDIKTRKGLIVGDGLGYHD